MRPYIICHMVAPPTEESTVRWWQQISGEEYYTHWKVSVRVPNYPVG